MTGLAFQAPAMSGGGGSFDVFAGFLELPGTRKNTQAVTISPRALATAVRRRVTSWAKTANTSVPLSRKGAAITNTISPSAAVTVSRKSTRGRKDGLMGDPV